MKTTLYFTKRDMHLHTGLNPYADQAKLRYHAFRSMEWDVAYFDGDEWEEDEYDMPPHTEYLVYYDGNEALACCRLVRTDSEHKVGNTIKSYMIRDVFDGAADYKRNLLSARGAVEGSDSILEGTRFAIAPRLMSKSSKEERHEAISQITTAMVKRCLQKGVTQVVGVMPVGVWKSVWESRGCMPEWLGPEMDLDGKGILRAGSLQISSDTLNRMQRQTGILHISLKGPENNNVVKQFVAIPSPLITINNGA